MKTRAGRADQAPGLDPGKAGSTPAPVASAHDPFTPELLKEMVRALQRGGVPPTWKDGKPVFEFEAQYGGPVFADMSGERVQ